MEFIQSFLFSENYELSRFLFQRGLAFIYFFAFLIIVNQYVPLLGKDGLMPIHRFVKRVSFKLCPSIFFRSHGDKTLKRVAYLGLGVSLFCFTGYSEAYGLWLSMICWATLWVLYLSYCNLGQLFYGYGWESLLLETGFLAIFLGDQTTPVSLVIIWLLRFIAFKNMLGAGLIKIRGDQCWKDGTALYYHFETQPIPNPLSLFFHNLPKVVLKGGVFFNHFIELIVPIFCLAPWWIGTVAALLVILFQVTLIISGNLSWLNYISIVVCIPCINDDFWSLFFTLSHKGVSLSAFWLFCTTVVALFLIYKNRYPVLNMFSRSQSMNRSFDSYHLCNTYGAFGSVTKTRYELVILGSPDSQPTAESEWREYRFYGKPNLERDTPPIISPYHRRLDWQIWFSAMGTYHNSQWIFMFIHKLLSADKEILKLLKEDPFHGNPPGSIKIDKYLYKMPKAKLFPKVWWNRSYYNEFLPPLNLQHPSLNEIVRNLS